MRAVNTNQRRVTMETVKAFAGHSFNDADSKMVRKVLDSTNSSSQAEAERRKILLSPYETRLDRHSAGLWRIIFDSLPRSKSIFSYPFASGRWSMPSTVTASMFPFRDR